MVQFLVTGHGNFATGIKSSIDLIAGSPSNIHYVDFASGMSSETLKSEIDSVLSKNNDAEFLIMADLAGGTPFRVGAELSIANNNVKVIAGVNLAMILGVIFEDNISLQDISEKALKAATDGVKDFSTKK